MARAIDADRLADGLKLHRQPTDQKHEADRQWAVGYNAGLDRALLWVLAMKGMIISWNGVYYNFEEVKGSFYRRPPEGEEEP